MANTRTATVVIDGQTILSIMAKQARKYNPLDEKDGTIKYCVRLSCDQNTGTFSVTYEYQQKLGEK